MSGFGDEPAVSPAEVEAAQKLAAALKDGSDEAEVMDLALAFLLQAAGGGVEPDELAARRLRAELVTAARHRAMRRRSLRRLAAAAALLAAAAAGVMLSRHPLGSHTASLEARERAARAAVGRVAASWNADAVVLAHVAARLDSEWRGGLEGVVRSNRFVALVARASDQTQPSSAPATPRPTRPASTPGGVS